MAALSAALLRGCWRRGRVIDSPSGKGGATGKRRGPALPLARRDHLVIVICNEGYQSSLAAENLRRLGLDVTDVVGGFQAWREAGLAVEESGV
jgi:rhodanese-related sulfurtransferase